MDQAGLQVIPADRPSWADLIDLASYRMCGKAIATSDDFFASKDNLLKPERALFIPGKFTPRGKWMDGWESRRRRTPGHDWCIIKLGQPGTVRGTNVDTSHFNGNQPEYCTVEGAEIARSGSSETNAGAASARAASSVSRANWVEIVSRTPLTPSSEHYIPVSPGAHGKRFTHIRLNIFPDGGVARLRVHGEVIADWTTLAKSKAPIELSAATHGGLVIAANDMHFGSRHNLIMPDRAPNMGDGWETRRKRNLTWIDDQPAEHDWAIIKLAHRGTITAAEIDTHHFKGNFPESAMVEVCDAPDSASGESFDPEILEWRVLVPRAKLKADTRHVFKKELDRAAAAVPCTHARLSIFPDGGVSRLRLWGRPLL